jgi:hypothetical protein
VQCVPLCSLKQRSRDISAAAGIGGMAAYALARFESQCLHRRLQNSGAIAHAEARAIASKPWSKDGSESRGQAGVTGPPGSANPLCPCTLHALVAVRTSADASTVWEGGLAYLSKNHQPNRPACRRPRSACIPCSRCPELIVAPGAWMWSVICARVQGFSKDLRVESP